ncbi:MAG: alkaline phosphatase family protein, partial [Bacteroidales bacterium]|nr:alkaline phosphatase family protein [Bacteroidales bacterium]
MIKLTQILIVLSGICLAYAQSPPKKSQPKLLIAITIDQLRSDYLQLFFDGFGEHGFKRLMRDGVLYTDVCFEIPHIDKSTAAATVFTGATPFYHSIASDYVYNTRTKKIVSSL